MPGKRFMVMMEKVNGYYTFVEGTCLSDNINHATTSACTERRQQQPPHPGQSAHKQTEAS
eukprot:10443445-Prorocentrum_lima.AAC.1